MPAVALCMIVKNEEEVLARCLTSIQEFVDEIIVVDTGSTDRTREIARDMGAELHEFEWIDDFAAARNFSFSKAHAPYVMWLDADDVVLPAERDKLLEVKDSLVKDAYYLRYDVQQDTAGNSLCMFYRERIIRRDRGIHWSYPIHECMTLGPEHTWEQLPITITHKRPHRSDVGHATRNLRILEKSVARDEYRTDARLRYYLGREYLDHGREHDAVEELRCFLKMPDGWIEDRICAQQKIAKAFTNLAWKEPGHRAEHLAQARIEARRARAMDDRWAEPHYLLGLVALEEGDAEEAVFWLEKCLRPAPPVLNPLDGWSYGAGPLIQLCLAHYRLGDLDRAEEYNERALELLPDNPDLHRNRRLFKTERKKG